MQNNQSKYPFTPIKSGLTKFILLPYSFPMALKNKDVESLQTVTLF